MLLLFLVATMLLAPWPVNVWIVALSACPSWYRDHRRGLLTADTGQPGVEVPKCTQEVLVPGDRFHSLCEYVRVTRGQHSGYFLGETLIDVTPPRDSSRDTHRSRIGHHEPGATNRTGEP